MMSSVARFETKLILSYMVYIKNFAIKDIYA